MDLEKSCVDISDVQNIVLSLQYETQHFGFHPRTFLDEVYNRFFKVTTIGLTDMKRVLIKEFKEVMPENLISSQTDILLIEIQKQLDKAIDKLEVYLNKNVFAIEKHVILPEDEVHVKNPCTKEDDENIDLEIAELKQKIFQEQAKQCSLKTNISNQKEVKKKLLLVQKELKALIDTAYQKGATPENAERIYSDLAELNDCSLVPF